MLPETPRSGQVWAVSTGTHLAADLIRFGEELIEHRQRDGRPGESMVNHVAGVSHQDKQGTWWGIEGRPGGVGWVDLATYRDSRWARFGNSNEMQPLTDENRSQIVYVASSLLGDPYDWVGGITADALRALDMKGASGFLEQQWGNHTGPGQPRPAHVVCSSLYAYVYSMLHLSYPDSSPVEEVTPADWWLFNDEGHW